MSSLVLAETCPPPECNLSLRDVEALVDELKLYHARFGPAFCRPEQFYWSEIYLKGLLGDEPRKSIEPIALQAGVNVRALQYFIGQSPWRIESVPGSGPGQALENPKEIKFYLSNAPVDIDPAELVRISGMCWPVETAFEQGKEEIGLDHYETRSWLGWHHHMTLSFLAHHFLVRLRIQPKGLAPALTVERVRLLLRSVLPKPVFDAAAALRRVIYYQKRNHAAHVSHRKSKLRQLALLGNFAL